MCDHDRSRPLIDEQDSRQGRDRPQVSIRTAGFRFELARLPRRPRLPRWIPAFIGGVVPFIAEVIIHRIR